MANGGVSAAARCIQVIQSEVSMSSTAVQVDRALSALPPLKLFIGGRWIESNSQEQIDVVSPATGKLLAKIPHASAADVNRAVESARKAWDGWRRTPPFVRA